MATNYEGSTVLYVTLVRLQTKCKITSKWIGNTTIL